MQSIMIKKSNLTYAEGFDKICLIVDRDRDSFQSKPDKNQYTYVLKKCREKGFGLYVTNPCFEFWLLLHFDEVFRLDRDRLLKNPKVGKKKRYAEKELCKIYPGYGKSSYQAEDLVENIDRAIRNEKKFCEDLSQLEKTVGSNLGKLIEEMRRPDSNLF